METVDLETKTFEIWEASGAETSWTSKLLYFPAIEPIRTLGSAMEDSVCTLMYPNLRSSQIDLCRC
jgi:hypothetical protein